MKFLSVAATALLAAALDSALGGEIANPARQENYDSGEMHMMIMGNKRHSFDIHRGTGAYNSSAYPKITKYSPCVDGMAAGQFRCKNVDLAYFASHADLGSITGEGSSSWGWTSPDGREFIIVAQVAILNPYFVYYNLQVDRLINISRPTVLHSLKYYPMVTWTILGDFPNRALPKSGVVCS